MLEQQDVEKLVEEELSGMEPEIQARIAQYLVCPYKQMRFRHFSPSR